MDTRAKEQTLPSLSCDNSFLGGCHGPVEYCWAVGTTFCAAHHLQTHRSSERALVACRRHSLRNLERAKKIRVT